MALLPGDCLESLRKMPDCSVDSIVTDPPYGLAFMGKRWDYDVPSVEIWAECLRVLKPGGHLLAFAGTRTQHRMAVRIEDAGFEIRDMIAWVYGSGFPKSMDVSKAIDRAAGAEREVLAVVDPRGTFDGRERGSSAINANWRDAEGRSDLRDLSKKEITAPATESAEQWQGWGTALKPALEPITVARKPLIGTVAANVLAHGTGALNIDGCRVGFENETDKATAKPGGKATAKSGNLAGKSQDGFVIFGPDVDGERLYWSVETGWGSRDGATVFHDAGVENPIEATGREPATQRAEFVAVQGDGRWPANLIHDGSDEVVGLFPANAGGGFGKRGGRESTEGYRMHHDVGQAVGFGDTGSAARFFYCAKASKKDRDEGLGAFAAATAGEMTGGREEGSAGLNNPRAGAGRTGGGRNIHPTVKPTDLMRYLCRLVTPPGGTVLDPFMGSGSTGKAAMLEGFRFIGCELSPEYLEIARARIDAAAGSLKEPCQEALELA